MLAHYHGQVWNAVEPAQAIGSSQPTVRRYLDILTGMFMIRQLQPLLVNIGKRQVKSPKIYFRDSGILHSLLNITTQHDLLYHPKCGASWEGYIIEEVLKTTSPDAAYFWATQNGAEIDLIIESGNRRWGIECKRADAPKLTPSMRFALEDLGIEQIAVIYPGTRWFAISEQVVAVPIESIASGMSGIFGK
jgi:predicted AAA+ superfamily ATPase